MAHQEGPPAARVSTICQPLGGACAEPSTSAWRGRATFGDTDAAYGNRVFLCHYCVHLSGVALRESLPDYQADIPAARGFNGDIAIHAEQWRLALDARGDRAELARRLARKSLDYGRAGSVSRRAEIEPELARDRTNSSAG